MVGLPFLKHTLACAWMGALAIHQCQKQCKVKPCINFCCLCRLTLLLIVVYLSLNISLNIINKYTLSHFNFKFP